MRLTRDTTGTARQLRVACLECGRMLLLSEAIIDLDGPAFKAYYHPECLNEERRYDES